MNRHGSLRTEQLESRQLLAADFSVGGDMATQMAAFREQLMRFQFEPAQVENREFASIDGTGNNLADPELGSTDEQLLRLTTVEYGDGISTPAGEDRPSAREISNAVAAQLATESNDRYLTDIVWLWGQFIDHDIDLTENADPAEPFPIEVPEGDIFFDPDGNGDVTMGLNRSIYDETTGDSIDDPRQQINQITAFLDGSVVYGSDQERADALRTFTDGKLKTSEGDLLPFNEEGFENAGGTSDTLFLAGDVRANENAALTSIHTLFVREHNRLADEISAADPTLTDEEIFQQARAKNVAQIQSITFNQYLPALLGESAISHYDGYDPSVNPEISNLFSTASYRFGHSMLSSELLRLNNDGTVIDDGNLDLASAFFAPGEIIDNGIDSLLLGLSSNLANEIDSQIVDDVRNFLFGAPGSGGFDLASLNIQRGRDHGLADYNQVRVDLGLEAVTSFSDITSDHVLADKLEMLYGDVNNIDVWVGALAEDHVEGSSLGELNQAVIVDQFERLRDGDRFWYQNLLSGRELAEVENTTLSDIIERNTGITDLRDNVFYDESVLHHRVAEGSGSAKLRVAVEGETVEIVDSRTSKVLESRSIEDTSKLILVGSNGGRDEFTIDMSHGGVSLDGGIEIHGGTGRGDVMIVRGTKAADTISAAGSTVEMNGDEMNFGGIELVKIEPGRGMDDVQVADDMDAQVIVKRDTPFRTNPFAHHQQNPGPGSQGGPGGGQQTANGPGPGGMNSQQASTGGDFMPGFSLFGLPMNGQPIQQQTPGAANGPTFAEGQQQAANTPEGNPATQSPQPFAANHLMGPKTTLGQTDQQQIPPQALQAARMMANLQTNNQQHDQNSSERDAREFLFGRHGFGPFDLDA